MPPMSIVGHPKSDRMPVTVAFAPSSLPQMNMSGGPPGSWGLIIKALPTMLKALTTFASGTQRWTCFPGRVRVTEGQARSAGGEVERVGGVDQDLAGQVGGARE